MGRYQYIALGVFAWLCQCDHASVQALVIQKANREISLATQIVRVNQNFEVLNDGASPVTEFLFCSTQDQAAHLAFEEGFQGEDDDPLKVVAADVADIPVNVSCSAGQLTTPIAPGKTSKIEILSVYTELQKPWPAAITQSDPQRMLYFDNIYIFSPYTVASQSTKVKLPSRTVEAYTKVQPAVLSGTTLKYGPYSNIAPFKTTRMRLHFEQNTPFAQVVSLVKEIEVSHWGNVYVEEIYELKHAGALHKGVWSRLDFQTNGRTYGQAAFNELVAILPANAHSLYYKDEIGNISSSNVRQRIDQVEAYIRPRFPLFGGWSTKFTFGYSLPLPSVIQKTASGGLRLATSFSTPLRGVYVKDLTVKVVLPEGSKILSKDLPFVVEESTGKKYTYLDTAGRPVLYLHKSNVVEEHNQQFSVDYSFSTLHLLQEPLLLVGGFLAFFATIILYQRSDFTISHDKAWRAKELKIKATDVLESAAACLTELEKAVTSLEGSASGSLRSTAEQTVKTAGLKLKEALEEVEGVLGAQASMAPVLARASALQTAALGSGRCTKETKPVAELKKELHEAFDQILATAQARA